MFHMRKFFFLLLLIVLLLVFHHKILSGIGGFLVVQDVPATADAAVVLNTGADMYPRLMEAVNLYNQGTVAKVVINGNRKTAILRSLEGSGYTPPCKWYAEEMGILTHLGVPKESIVAISAEDVFDTISEAEAVGEILLNNSMGKVIIVTSKNHSRRARHIWKKLYRDRLEIYVAPARHDPFDPAGWWKDARQIHGVLYEYGSWIYYYWMRFFDLHLLS